MKLNSTIDLYAFGESAGTGGQSWLVHPPGLKTDTPVVRDMARRRLSKSNPDVDAAKVERKKKLKYKEKPQSDESAFVGKPLRVQDTLYGHLVSEHDNESSAQQAMLSRPYARILRHQEPAFSSYNKKGRNAARKKLVNKSPDDIY